jgi:hypothetical protein
MPDKIFQLPRFYRGYYDSVKTGYVSDALNNDPNKTTLNYGKGTCNNNEEIPLLTHSALVPVNFSCGLLGDSTHEIVPTVQPVWHV